MALDDTLSRAVSIRAPNDVGTTINENGCLFFTVPTAHIANALPAAWRGRRYVIIQHISGPEFPFAFSKNPTAEIDPAVAATAAGVSAKVGMTCRVGGDLHVELPDWGTAETMYFVREATAAATCKICLGDYTEKPVDPAIPHV